MIDYFTKHRKEIHLENIGLPNHIFIGKVDNIKAQRPLAPHVHQGCFEICYFYKGQQTYEIADQAYNVRGGELFFTCPYEPHSTRGNPEEKSGFYYLIFQLQDGEKLLYAGQEESAILLQTLLQSTQRVFPCPGECITLLDTIVKAYSEKSPFFKAWISAMLIEVLYLTMQQVSQGKGHTPLVKPQIRQIIERVAQHPEMYFTTQQMILESGLSASRFKQEFKAATGTTPHDFHMRKRIEMAQKQLEGNSSITDIAYELGFSSSQHFSTIFKKYKGLSPAEYRRDTKKPR